MEFKEVLEKSGMNQKEFSNYFAIPYRTVQSWSLGERKCPNYLLELMDYKLRKEGIMTDLEKFEFEVFTGYANRIALIKADAYLMKRDFRDYAIGDLILSGNCEVLKEWDVSEHAKAREELEKYRCSHSDPNERLVSVEEYALEYYKVDDEGEFLVGSEYEFAKEMKTVLMCYKTDEVFEDFEEAKTHFLKITKGDLHDILEDVNSFEELLSALEEYDICDYYLEDR